MRKLLACLMVLVLLLGGVALGEGTDAKYEELVVGAVMPMTGHFFTSMWGSNTSDVDVRNMLHSYSLVEWDNSIGGYVTSPNVVSGNVVTSDPAGNRTYTISLYSDLLYSDGSKISAADYAFSILLSYAPQMAEIGAAVNENNIILGAEDYRSGKSNALAGLRVLGENRLSITVSADYLPFFYELGLLDFCPYPISEIAPGCKVIDTNDGASIRDSEDTASSALFTAELLQKTVLNGYLSQPSVVSGPYTLTSFDGTKACFEINPYFKGNSAGAVPTIKRVIFTNVSNENMLESLQNGDVTLLNKVTSVQNLNDGSSLAVDEGYGMSSYARSGLSYISFNCEKTAVSSEKVRQAIACCLDKDAVVEAYVGTYGLRTDGYYGLGQWMVQLANHTVGAPVEAPAEGASAEEQAAYEAAVQAWEDFSLDGLKKYELDPETAVALLTEDGWTLNEAGGDFDPEADAVRCKNIDDDLVALRLTLVYPEGNAISDAFAEHFVPYLAKAGIELTMQAVPMNDLLTLYYRQQERDCDMFYLASNFEVLFDPSLAFSPDDAFQGVSNRTAIADQALYQAAVDMRETEPGETLKYCQKWLAFQDRFAEALPMIPVYSNVYMDFATPLLQNYNIINFPSWANAIVEAYLGDPVEEPAADAETVIGD